MSKFVTEYLLREKRLDGIFAASAKEARMTGRGSWAMVHSNGVKLRVSARLREDWLSFEAPLHGTRWESLASRPWELLRLNGRARGASGLALGSPGAPGPALLAEIPIGEGVPLETRIPETLSSLLENARLRRRKAVRSRHAAAKNSPDTDSVQRLCREAGWTFEVRSNGCLAVQLDQSAAATHPAIVSGGKNGSLRVRLPVLSWNEGPHAFLNAFGVLLLEVARSVCMVRAWAVTEEARTAIGFDVTIGADGTAEELDLALGAVSVACRECGEEAKLLRDPEVASKYLSVRGLPPEEPRRARNHSKIPA